MAKWVWLVMVVVGLAWSSSSGRVEGKTHVRIINALDNNLDLTIHCKSADDDLGEHVLHHSQFYEFSFRTSILPGRSTLFFCGFRWRGAFKWFDIYDEKRDADLCLTGKCDWQIKQSGPCMFDGPHTSAKFCYSYNNHP